MAKISHKNLSQKIFQPASKVHPPTPTSCTHIWESHCNTPQIWLRLSHPKVGQATSAELVTACFSRPCNIAVSYYPPACQGITTQGPLQVDQSCRSCSQPHPLHANCNPNISSGYITNTRITQSQLTGMTWLQLSQVLT